MADQISFMMQLSQRQSQIVKGISLYDSINCVIILLTHVIDIWVTCGAVVIQYIVKPIKQENKEQGNYSESESVYIIYMIIMVQTFIIISVFIVFIKLECYSVPILIALHKLY